MPGTENTQGPREHAPTHPPPLYVLVQGLAAQGLEGLEGNVGAAPECKEQEGRGNGQARHGA